MPPWVLLGRIPRHVGAQAAGAAKVEADAQAAGEAGDEEAELAAVFSFPLVATPQVTVMNAAPTAQPDPKSRDKYPYILGVHSACLLLNFGADLFPGVYFGDLPFQSNLVVVRDFNMADVEQGHPAMVTARAERIAPRDGEHAVVSNIESIGLLSTTPNDILDYVIVELMIYQGSNFATLVYIDSDGDKWSQEDDVPNPLPDHNRKWVPSGVVSHLGKLWWFDLSWGLISYDHFADLEVSFLLFHNLPEGRALHMTQPSIHDRRCITESQGELLYVEIIHDPDGDPEAAMVCMWTRASYGSDDDDNHETFGWHEEHLVSFEEIWNDDTYIETGLPRKVPVLVAVSPSKWDIVYFALEEEERLFSIDLLSCTVFEHVDGEYDLVTPWPVPPSCRYVLPWSLPPQVAQALGIIADSDDSQQLEVEIVGDLQQLEGEIVNELANDEELQEAEIQEKEAMAMQIDADIAELHEELNQFEAELIAEAQAQAALRAALRASADDEELLDEAETDDEEEPQAEIHDDDLSSQELLDEAETDDGEEPQAEIHDYDLSSEELLDEAEIDDGEEPTQAEIHDEELLDEAEIDDGEQPQAEIHDDDLSSEEMQYLSVKMDPETARRLKAEVKEYFSGKEDHPGPSQDPEDNAGDGAI